MAWYGDQPIYGQPQNPYYNDYYYGPPPRNSYSQQSPNPSNNYMNQYSYGAAARELSQNQTPSQSPMEAQQQSTSMPTNKNANLNCRVVSSFDEVKIAQIDIDGSTHVFLDVVNHKVYTKKILADGRPEYRAYNEVPVKEFQTATEYVTKAELEKILNSFKSSISSSAQGAVQQDSSAPQLNFFEGNGK